MENHYPYQPFFFFSFFHVFTNICAFFGLGRNNTIAIIEAAGDASDEATETEDGNYAMPLLPEADAVYVEGDEFVIAMSFSLHARTTYQPSHEVPPEMSGTIETASNHEGSINSTASSNEEYSGNEFDVSFIRLQLIHSQYLAVKEMGAGPQPCELIVPEMPLASYSFQIRSCVFKCFVISMVLS